MSTTTTKPPAKPAPTGTTGGRVDGGTSSSAAPTTLGPSRLFAVAAGGSALMLMGILFGAALWILAGLATAMLLGLSYYLANTWSAATTAKRLGGDLEVKIGSRIPIEITVTNQGALPVLWVLVEDLLPRLATKGSSPAVEIIGDRLRVMMLKRRESKTLGYEVRCQRRGYLQVGPTVLETGDLMGLFRRFRLGTQPRFITVLPRVELLSEYEVGSRRPIGEIRIRDNVMVDPTRLRGIRQWRPGDPLRSVHWAATARTGTLHSKVYEPSSIAGATIVLDLHVDTNPLRQEPVRTDLAVTAAASIAAALMDLGEPFGLATNGRDAADRVRQEGWIGDHRVRGAAASAGVMRATSARLRPLLIPPGRGPIQFRELLRTLARVERTDGLTLAEFLVESEPKLSNETTLLFIVQRCPAEAIASLVSYSRRGWAVAVIINTYEVDDYSSVAGPLIAERIPTFHLSGEQSLADVCRRAAIR